MPQRIPAPVPRHLRVKVHQRQGYARLESRCRFLSLRDGLDLAETQEYRTLPAARFGCSNSGRIQNSEASVASVLHRRYSAQPYRRWCRNSDADRRLPLRWSVLLITRTCRPAYFPQYIAGAPGSVCCCRNEDWPEPRATRVVPHRSPAGSADARLPVIRRCYSFDSLDDTRRS